MTTLYRPVLIESAEQAEALPVGTVATVTGGADAAVRVAFGNGWSVSGDELTDASEHMIGWMALVPIEAEEEWKTLHEGAWHLKADEDDARRDANALGARRRYTTDWEEA